MKLFQIVFKRQNNVFFVEIFSFFGQLKNKIQFVILQSEKWNIENIEILDVLFQTSENILNQNVKNETKILTHFKFFFQKTQFLSFLLRQEKSDGYPIGVLNFDFSLNNWLY